MKIIVIIPTYNEKENIEKMIPLLEKEIFPQIKNHQLGILIADDSSPDGTKNVVEKFMKEYKNLNLLEGKKAGLGAAYARAMRYAIDKLEAYAVIEFDADFQHDPHDLPRLVAAMDEGYDYVIGSRYIPGGAVPKEWGLDRKLLSKFGGLFARVVWLNFSIHDITSGFKLTKTEYLKKVDLEHLYSKAFAYKLHVLHDVVKMGAKVKEIPIIFYERKEGVSKINKKESFESMFVVLRLKFDDSIRIIKFLFVGGTGFIIQLLLQEGSARIFHVPDWLAVGVGAESAIISNFLINHFWTFNDTHSIKESSNIWVKMVKFNIASLGSIIIQVVAIWLAELVLGPNMHIFGFMLKTRIAILFPTIIFLVIPLNYIIYNKVIWKTQYLKKNLIVEENKVL